MRRSAGEVISYHRNHSCNFGTKPRYEIDPPDDLSSKCCLPAARDPGDADEKASALWQGLEFICSCAPSPIGGGVSARSEPNGNVGAAVCGHTIDVVHETFDFFVHVVLLSRASSMFWRGKLLCGGHSA